MDRSPLKKAGAAAFEAVAIVGGGNIGAAVVRGLVASGYPPGKLWVTRRRPEHLAGLGALGVRVGTDNAAAVRSSSLVVLAVRPEQAVEVLRGLRRHLVPSRHALVSVVTGVGLRELRALVGPRMAAVRAMPNTAVSIRESMTCLAAEPRDHPALARAASLFDRLGRTLVIPEEHMVPATALCACGVAFFLRAIRAASQGGIEIGFHAEEAVLMAAQTARGAASLLLHAPTHAEAEIDKVTTPMGCTIAGLNQMEHEGFSSALIKGIVTSAEKASTLFKKPRK